MNVRRLEAEAIRDALLAVSGRLEPVMYGPERADPPDRFHGRPGPARAIGPARRRRPAQPLLEVRRNFLNPMFLAFDLPVPFSTMGRRNVSNVPAQALTLMNDPMIVARPDSGPSAFWRATLDRIDRGSTSSTRRLSADCRPRPEEPRDLAFLAAERRGRDGGSSPRLDETVRAWADLCHVMINMKEFIFVD